MTTQSANSFIKKYFPNVSLILSYVCLLHCLALPFVLILLPTMSHFLSGTVEHVLILSIVPISIIGFVPTWLKHKDYKLGLTFVAGLTLILFSQYGIEHIHIDSQGDIVFAEMFTIFWERTILMLIGVILLAYATYKNNQHTHVCSNPHHHHHH